MRTIQGLMVFVLLGSAFLLAPLPGLADSGSKTTDSIPLFAIFRHENFIFQRVGMFPNNTHARDGHGYPEGLKGDEIPLSAQIMAVADAYNALRTKRSYKKALSHEESRDVILAETGTHFSPAVGAAFASIEKEMARISQQLVDE